MNLSINKCRGQCFDSASVMTGIKNGVATQIANEEKHAVFIHCYGHALNFAIGDAVKNSSILKDALDIAYKISELIQFSPKRQERFDRIKDELAPDYGGIRTLCPTRYTLSLSDLIVMIFSVS